MDDSLHQSCLRDWKVKVILKWLKFLLVFVIAHGKVTTCEGVQRRKVSGHLSTSDVYCAKKKKKKRVEWMNQFIFTWSGCIELGTPADFSLLHERYGIPLERECHNGCLLGDGPEKKNECGECGEEKPDLFWEKAKF